MTAFRVTGIILGARQAVLVVAIGDEQHRVAVTAAGAVLVPAALARHHLRQDIEAEARVVAAASWLGKASVAP
ncbi:MAG: hypothetical protein EOP13_25165 [Pseudomonas sp.]|uniref:hypothetical protein n=1 Tax=Pseudomonas sp. TaxID=306 RepID=UPI001209AFF9|nr:hypothetical protein [Pseudomonas sp.]RZI68408.1 MAG: hypothetical protein EOP13_25165 [Pseudomonas sp.]